MNPKLFSLLIILGLGIHACGNNPLSVQEPTPIQVQSTFSFSLTNSAWSSAWSAENRLQVAMPSIPSNLNPFANPTSTGQAIQRQLHGFLWKTNPLTGRPQADLCSKIVALADQKNTWQLNLHQNRFFESNNPNSRCMAADVAFSLKAFSIPGLAHSAYQNALQPLKKIELSNDSTLKLEFWGNDSALMYALADVPILREAEWDPNKSLRGLGQAFQSASVDAFPNMAMAPQKNSPGQGLGPYSLLDFQPSQLVRMRLKTAPALAHSAPDTLDWVWLGDATGLKNHLEFQRADVFSYLTLADFTSFKKNKTISTNYHLSAIQTQTLNFLAFNSKPLESGQHPAMQDPRVRLALAYLTPKQQLLSTLFDSSLKPIEGLGHLGPKKKKTNPDFQPEKAKALLMKAGWTDSDNNGILDKTINGKSVNLNLVLLYNSSSKLSEDLVSLIQGHWLKHGIALEKKAQPSASFYAEAQNHHYDIVLTGFSAKYSAAHMRELWHSESWYKHGHNYTGFGNTHSDSLLQQLGKPISASQEEELLSKLQDLILEQTPWIPLHYSQRYMATHRRWHGVNVLSLPPGFMPEEFRLGKGR